MGKRRTNAVEDGERGQRRRGEATSIRAKRPAARGLGGFGGRGCYAGDVQQRDADPTECGP